MLRKKVIESYAGVINFIWKAVMEAVQTIMPNLSLPRWVPEIT